MKTYWHNIWICKCGYNFGEGSHSRFLTFGFNHLCPDCAEDVGSHGDENAVKRKTVKWVREVEFNLFSPLTWLSHYNRVEKSNN